MTDEREEPPRAVVVDLGDEWNDALGQGVTWTLEPASQLNASLVRLEVGGEIGEHVNHEVDVLLVVVEGTGEVSVEETTWALGPATLVHIPAGARRCISAGPQPFAYLSIHRRRTGLTIKPKLGSSSSH